MKAWKLWSMCTFLAMCVAYSSEAATEVPSGNLTGSELWTVEGSPYILTGDVTIRQAQSLTIEAGVLVQLDTAAGTGGLIVQGRLVTQGTKENPVVFTSAKDEPAPGDWSGIRVQEGGHMELNWANLSYGSYCIDASPGSTGEVKVLGGRAEGCTVGVRINNSARNISDAPVIDGMTVTGSTSHGFVVGISNRSSAHAVLNNIISTNNLTGIYTRSYLLSQTVNIFHATIADNTENGIDARQDTSTGPLTINIVNSIVANNGGYGIKNYTNSGSSSYDATYDIRYSHIWNTRDYFGVNANPGTSSGDPYFVDPANGNYRLQQRSPCIDAGTTTTLTTDADGNPRVVDGGMNGLRPDMGAYEYQPCEDSTTCSGNGSCNTTTGSCNCNTGFEGQDCSVCAPGYSGPNCTTTPCEDSTTCNGNGSCNATGGCECFEGFNGPNCNPAGGGSNGTNGGSDGTNGGSDGTNGGSDGANGGSDSESSTTEVGVGNTSKSSGCTSSGNSPVAFGFVLSLLMLAHLRRRALATQKALACNKS